jgi:hypothetical protein
LTDFPKFARNVLDGMIRNVLDGMMMDDKKWVRLYGASVLISSNDILD